ncbi:MAG: pilus assembly protein PilM [Pseudomonadota bacterium]
MLKGKFNIPLGSFLQLGTPPMIGVDISSSSVKMVELSAGQKGGYVLEAYAIESLPKDAVVDGNINNLDAVTATLLRACGKLGSRVRNVCLALPAAAVITKKIFLPAGLREEDMEAQVEAEANQYIPFALDEVNLDFQVVREVENNPDEVEVLLAVSRKANVEDRVAAAQSAGLKAVVMDVETFAAAHAVELICEQFPDHAENECVALVDIGANVMSVNILRNGQSVYTRDQQIGGDQLTQQIHVQLGVSLEEAELGKRSGNLPESYETSVLEPFRETIAAEITRAIQFFFASTPYNEVNYIVLAGGCAALPGLDSAVASRTQVSTVVANPFARMGISSHLKGRHLATDAPALLTACGLALRRFDPS